MRRVRLWLHRTRHARDVGLPDTPKIVRPLVRILYALGVLASPSYVEPWDEPWWIEERWYDVKSDIAYWLCKHWFRGHAFVEDYDHINGSIWTCRRCGEMDS